MSTTTAHGDYNGAVQSYQLQVYGNPLGQWQQQGVLSQLNQGFNQLGGGNWGLGSSALTYITGGTQVMAKAKQASGLIIDSNGTVIEVCDSVDDAKRKARALTAKNLEEYLVFKACARIAPKPVDLDETELA